MITINITSFIAGFIVGMCVFVFCMVCVMFREGSMWNDGFDAGFKSREMVNRLLRIYDEHNEPKEDI